MVASQLARLHQTEPVAWILWDYAGRIGALAVLAATPPARAIAFQRERLDASRWELALRSILWLVVIDAVLKWLPPLVDAAIPGARLDAYPATHGWLHVFDVIAGLALVAYHEEIVFRRVARQAFQPWLGDGAAMVVTTSAIFATYHWWSALGNICVAFLLGSALMVAYRRLGALWPVVALHYLIDLGAFV